MPRIYLLCTLVFSGCLTATALYADNGKALYEANCTGCHDTSVFTRGDRRVKNMDELRNRVRQCSYAIKGKWLDKDIDAVLQYLNNSFYKFQ